MALRLLAEEPTRANKLIEWGKNCDIHTHPLHYVSDMLFNGNLERGNEMAIVDVLLAAGADCNFPSKEWGDAPDRSCQSWSRGRRLAASRCRRPTGPVHGELLNWPNMARFTAG
jgi:hypothetical protein